MRLSILLTFELAGGGDEKLSTKPGSSVPDRNSEEEDLQSLLLSFLPPPPVLLFLFFFLALPEGLRESTAEKEEERRRLLPRLPPSPSPGMPDRPARNWSSSRPTNPIRPTS